MYSNGEQSMQTRKLGRTDIQVSLICLGTMTFGEQNTEAQAHDQLSLAVERGINFIDTAELYSIPVKAETQGLTERYIGTWLRGRQDRDKLIIATKVAGPGQWIKYMRGGPRLNAEHINQAIDASLRRLQTDYVDLYQVHWPGRNTNYFGKLGYTPAPDPNDVSIEETLTALSKLVETGKVRTIGVSNETPWGVMRYLTAAQKLGLERVVTIQNPYSLLNRSFEVGLAEVADREQVGLLAYSPLGFGTLSGKYLAGWPSGARLTRWRDYFPRYISEKGVVATRKYGQLAQEHGISPTHMALAFVNSRPFLTANIIGATTLQQLEENIASAQTVLPEALLEAIEAIHQQDPNPCP